MKNEQKEKVKKVMRFDRHHTRYYHKLEVLEALIRYYKRCLVPEEIKLDVCTKANDMEGCAQAEFVILYLKVKIEELTQVVNLGGKKDKREYPGLVGERWDGGRCVCERGEVLFEDDATSLKGTTLESTKVV